MMTNTTVFIGKIMDYLDRRAEQAAYFMRFRFKFRLWHAAAILFLAVAGVYINSLSNGLVNFDDAITLQDGGSGSDNVCFREFRKAYDNNPFQALRKLAFSRPLRELSLCVDKKIFGDDIWGYHFSNMLYHWLAACGAFLAASLIFSSAPPALLAALIFALHPLQTESVAYLGGRRDTLFGGLYLWGFWLAISAFTRRSRPLTAAALVVWALALASKEAAVTLPAAVVLYILFFRRDKDGGALPAKLKMPAAIFLTLATVYAFYAIVQQNSFSRTLGVSEMFYGGSALAQYLTVPLLFAKAVIKAVLPLPLNGDFSYLVIAPVQGLTDIRLWSSALFLLLLSAAALKLRKNFPGVSFGILFYLIAYLPMLPLFPTSHNMEVFAEHWLYLPVFGFAVALTALLRALKLKLPLKLAAGICLLAFYGISSAARNLDWKNAEIFWEKTAATSPSCARALANLAAERYFSGRTAEAEKLFRNSLEIAPGGHTTRLNYALLLENSGRLSEAGRVLKAGLELKSSKSFLSQFYLFLARLALKSGDKALANRHLGRAFGHDVTGEAKAQAVEMRGLLYYLDGNSARAVIAYKKALTLAPFSPTAAHSLGDLYYDANDYAAAAGFYNRALAAAPDYARSLVKLSAAESMLGNPGKAFPPLLRALNLAPELPETQLAAALFYRRQGKFKAALRYALRAAEKEGNNAGAALEAAISLRETGQLAKAEVYFERSLALGPSNQDARLFYADLLWSTGRFDEAYREIRLILRRNPASGPALKALRIMDEDLAAMRRSGN